MRVTHLLWLGLSSCSLLVRSIDPCVANTPNPPERCFSQRTPQALSGDVVQIKTGDIDGDGRPDVVVRTDNNGSLKIDALLSTQNFTVVNLSTEADLAGENILSFDLANMDEIPVAGAPSHVVMLTNTAAIILDQAALQTPLRIDIDGFNGEIFVGPNGEDNVVTTSPQAIIAGNFIPDVEASSSGREIAVAYVDSDAGDSPQPNTTNIVVFDVGTSNSGQFVSLDIPDVLRISAMGSHNVDGTVNNSADEFFIIVESAVGSEGIFFVNTGTDTGPPTRELLSGELPADIQIESFNGDTTQDLLLFSEGGRDAQIFFLQFAVIGGISVGDITTDFAFGEETAVFGLVNFDGGDGLVQIDQADTLKYFNRDGAEISTPEAQLLLQSEAPPRRIIGEDLDNNGAEDVLLFRDDNTIELLFTLPPSR